MPSKVVTWNVDLLSFFEYEVFFFTDITSEWAKRNPVLFLKPVAKFYHNDSRKP